MALSKDILSSLQAEKAGVLEQLDAEILRTEDRLARLKDMRSRIASHHAALNSEIKATE